MDLMSRTKDSTHTLQEWSTVKSDRYKIDILAVQERWREYFKTALDGKDSPVESKIVPRGTSQNQEDDDVDPPSVDEVERTMKKLNNNSAGLDGIKAKL
ncbi:hypothetical protein TNIN_194051 [Trichonephila inaurata madagascariensis]|uniref:Uncharacterized protein n=1 Tax=Trichonephila inaurata madagascariensis TaxID=2747483 RepID=A0A8X6ICV4_9ARAC|nr:hypothetical protein TNIN_194051 [Trichonephila inaurata madagascariensis]